MKPGYTFSTDNYVFRSLATYQISERFLIRNIPNITLDISKVEIAEVKNVIPPEYHHYLTPEIKASETFEGKDSSLEIGMFIINTSS